VSDAGKRISIAMTTYNSERFIAEQLESFVRQERLPDELVVSDDASTDRTVEIVRRFAARAPFPVRLSINDCNLGITRNFERAITECTGDIIFSSDSDDYWYPQKIRLMEKALDETPQAGLAVCNADLVNERLEPLGLTAWADLDRFFPSRRLSRAIGQGKIYLRRMSAGGCCMAFRSKFKPLILPLLEGFDYFIARVIICSGAGGAALIPEPLLANRRHPGQASRANDAPFHTRALRHWAARHECPRLLQQLIERVESDFAAQCCLNPALRSSALRHWRARVDMPPSFARRLPVVARELIALRYHRFSGSARPAVKDLFFSRQPEGDAASGKLMP
jgi:glycosyltransferase involved in cell wall biosynthesis